MYLYVSNYLSLKSITDDLLFLYRYLLDLNKSSDDAPDPYKEAVIDQWVEWESKSLQVSCSRGWNCFKQSVNYTDWETEKQWSNDFLRYFEPSGQGFSPSRDHCAVFLTKTINFYSVSTHPGA